MIKFLSILIIVLSSINVWAETFQVVAFRNFQLKQPKTHHWEKEKPQYTKGTLLIVRVDKEQFQYTQSYMPTVMIGDRVLERLNSGYNREYLAFISPQLFDLNRAGLTIRKLNQLPDQLKSEMRTQLSSRTKKTITNIRNLEKLATLKLKDEDQLYREAGQLLLKHDPGAKKFIEHWL